jgi:hypothetical protein
MVKAQPGTVLEVVPEISYDIIGRVTPGTIVIVGLIFAVVDSEKVNLE